MKADLRKKAKTVLKKIFFRLKKNAVFGKITENVRKDRYLKLLTTEV